MTTFNKQELQSRLALVKSSVAKNSPMASLNLLRISVSKDKFELTCGNGEIQVTAKGSCVGNETFSECVSPSTFAVMLSAAKNEIEITAKDGKLNTVSGRSKFAMPCTDGQLYPMLAMNDEINNVDISKLLSRVYKATAKNDVRIMLNGVCLHAKDHILNAIASDGAMMMVNTREHEIDDFQIIIPAKSAEFISSIETDGFVVSGQSLKVISITNGIEIITKLIDAKYVDWQRALTKHDKNFTVDKEQIINAVSIISSAGHDNVQLKSNDGYMSVSTYRTNDSVIDTSVDFEGDSIDAIFDPAKLMLCISALTQDKIELGFDSKGQMQATDEGFRFVLGGKRR